MQAEALRADLAAAKDASAEARATALKAATRRTILEDEVRVDCHLNEQLEPSKEPSKAAAAGAQG